MPAAYADISSLVQNFQQAGERMDQAAARVVHDIAMSVVQHAKANAPVKSGALRNSISASVTDPKTVVIGPHVPYGAFVEFGTGTRGEFPGHVTIINAKPGGVLRFKVNGKWVITKRVHSQGMKARPYMRPAIEQALGVMAQQLSEQGALFITRGPNA